MSMNESGSVRVVRFKSKRALLSRILFSRSLSEPYSEKTFWERFWANCDFDYICHPCPSDIASLTKTSCIDTLATAEWQPLVEIFLRGCLYFIVSFFFMLFLKLCCILPVLQICSVEIYVAASFFIVWELIKNLLCGFTSGLDPQQWQIWV